MMFAGTALQSSTSNGARARRLAAWIERGVRIAASCGELPYVGLSVTVDGLEIRYRGRRPDDDLDGVALRDDSVVLTRAFGPQR